MGVSVDCWQWRQLLLSKHGPTSASMRLVLLSIPGETGSSQTQAWPSQETIAERAQISVRQAKRLLKDAELTDWVRRLKAKKSGKAWFYTVYEFCVPPNLLNLIPSHKFKQGDIAMALRAQQGDTNLSPRESPKNVERPVEHVTQADEVTSGVDVVTNGTINGVTNGVDVVTPRWPMKYLSEVSKREVPIQGALPRTSHATVDPETERRAKAEERDNRKRASIIRLLKAGTDEADIARYLGKSQGVTLADVRAEIQKREAT